MNITLTGQEKIMNMAKLGIVSGAGIDFDGRKFLIKINRMRKSLYTLCVIDNRSTWNGWRHSFAVNIPPVSRTSGAPDELARTGKPRSAVRVAVSVPLQLIPISGSNRNFSAHRSNPLCVWLRGAFLSVINYSALAHGDTCRVTNKTRLNLYASRLTEVFQGATDFHAVTHDTISPTCLKPYGIRLQGRSAGVSNYSMLCDQVTPEKQRVERSSACCFDCVTVTELPDLLPRRRPPVSD